MRAWLRNFSLAAVIAVCFACGGSGSTGGGTVVSPHAVVVASGFDQPMLYLVDPADSTRAYVIERPGRVRLLVNDVLQSANVLDITGTVVTDGECGFLGMAFDPNFATNRYVYFHFNAGSPIETRIVRYTMNAGGTSLSSSFPILSFQQPSTTNHKGGDINFGTDGFLYVMTGDGGSGNDPDNNAQTPTTFLGKILRIDVTGDDFTTDLEQNYSVPVNNPWVGDLSVKPEIWGFGMRNPFRWSVDAVTGGLLIADVGQGAYEEMNYEPAGQGHRNYGWSLREGAHDTGNPGPAFFTPLTEPFLEYDHSFGATVIGGFIYRGSALDPSLHGHYFFADFISSKIVSAPFSLTTGGEAVTTSISASTNHTATINSTLGGNTVSRPVSITPDKNGEIMIMDLDRGTLLRLVP